MAKLTHDDIVRRFKLRAPELYGWNPVTDLILVEEEEQIYRYKDNIWTAVNFVKELRQLMYNFLTDEKKCQSDPLPASLDVTSPLVNNLVTELALSMALDARIPNTRSHYVGLLSDKFCLDTDTWELREPKRTERAFYRLNITEEQFLNPKPPTHFLEFLNGTILLDGTKETDTELVNFIQEMMGYLLLDTTQSEACFFLTGTGQNGKSTLLKVIEDVVGSAGVSLQSIEGLSTSRFSTQNLLGKRVNIIKEEDSDRVKSDLFKTLITGESISGERKFGDSFNFVPRVKFIFSTNKIPTFSRIDYAIRRRLYLVPFKRQLTDKEKNVGLGAELAKETAQITNWAIEGAKRLQARNFIFERPQSVQAAGKSFEVEQSSALAFFDENFEKCDDMDSCYMWSYLHGLYVEWCDTVKKKVKSNTTFKEEIMNRENDHERMPKEAFYFPVNSKMARGIRGFKLSSDQDAWIHRDTKFPENKKLV